MADVAATAAAPWATTAVTTVTAMREATWLPGTARPPRRRTSDREVVLLWIAISAVYWALQRPVDLALLLVASIAIGGPGLIRLRPATALAWACVWAACDYAVFDDLMGTVSTPMLMALASIAGHAVAVVRAQGVSWRAGAFFVVGAAAILARDQLPPNRLYRAVAAHGLGTHAHAPCIPRTRGSSNAKAARRLRRAVPGVGRSVWRWVAGGACDCDSI